MRLWRVQMTRFRVNPVTLPTFYVVANTPEEARDIVGKITGAVKGRTWSTGNVQLMRATMGGEDLGTFVYLEWAE